MPFQAETEIVVWADSYNSRNTKKWNWNVLEQQCIPIQMLRLSNITTFKKTSHVHSLAYSCSLTDSPRTLFPCLSFQVLHGMQEGFWTMNSLRSRRKNNRKVRKQNRQERGTLNKSKNVYSSNGDNEEQRENSFQVSNVQFCPFLHQKWWCYYHFHAFWCTTQQTVCYSPSSDTLQKYVAECLIVPAFLSLKYICTVSFFPSGQI